MALEAALNTYAGQACLWKFDKFNAFHHFSKALSLWDRIREPDPRLLGFTQWGLALSHHEYESQRAFYQNAIDRFVAIGDSHAITGACLDAGILQYRNGELEQMREALQLGAQYMGPNTRPAHRVRIDFQLGRYYEAIGDDESARFYFESAHRLAMATNPRDPVLFNIVRDLGGLLLRHADYDEAMALHRTMVSPDTGDKSAHRYFAEADIWFEMGRVCTAMGDYTAAESHLSRANENNARAGYGPGHIYTSNPNSALAHLYLVAGQPDKAEEKLVAVAEAMNNSEPFEHPDYAIINETAARTHLALEDFPGAIERINSGFTGLGYTLEDPHDFDRVYRYDLLANLINLLTEVRARQYAQAPQPETAASLDQQIALHLSFLDSIEQFEIQPAMRATILANNYHVFELALQRLHQQYQQTGDKQFLKLALDISERSRDQLLREIQLNNRLREQIEIPPALHQEELRLQQELIAIELELFRTPPEDSAAMRRLEAERRALNVLIADVSRKINRPGSQRNLPPLRDAYATAHQQLDERTAMLEFFDGEEEDFVFAIWRDGIACLALSSDEADRITDSLRTALIKPARPWRPAAYNAYQLLSPLMRQLPASTQHLIIAPAGNWSYIPFEALALETDNNADRLLIHSYSVSYTNAIHTHARFASPSRDARRLLAAFAPRYEAMQVAPEDTAGSEVFAALVRSGNYDLPGAQAEVASIGELIGGDIFTEDKASEASFRKRAPHYRILHLSMHALLEEDNPRFSRLVFSSSDRRNEDGYIFASELSTMDLKARMAVLSACNTGAGRALRGEGVMSLSRAFQYAGVPSIIHSLWKVPDGATADLMVGFYQYLKNGADKAGALRNAKLDYLENVMAPEHTHPYYWAGFVANGLTEPIDMQTPRRPADLLIYGLLALAVAVLGFLLSSRLRRRSSAPQPSR